VDVPTSPDRDGLWVNERWPEHAAPLEDVTWVAADGLRYPDAEITLPVKAELDRPKDNLDLAVTWPLLATDRQAWRRDAVRRLYPEHKSLTGLTG